MRFSLWISFGAILMMMTACQGLDEGLDNTMDNNNNDNGVDMIDTDNDGEGNQRQLRQQYRDNTNDNNGRNNRLNMMDTDNNQGINNNNNNDMNNNNNGDNNYEVANRAADQITNKINEIDQAYVLTGENNAYVAVVLENETNGNDEVNDRLKERVADEVRSINGDIENVYVSANPQFFNMVNNYADDVENGDPVEGFFEEFNDMIERIFPNLER